MTEGFVSLATSLRAATQGTPTEIPPLAASSPTVPEITLEELRREEVLQELGLARLAALEAYDRLAPALLESLAREVLGRELAIAPAQLEVIVAGVRAAFAGEEGVSLVVAPADADHISCGLPVRADPQLQPGDLVIEVRDGEIDARFSVRVACALEDAGSRVA